MPKILPTVAPVPAPTLPSVTGPEFAASAAFSPISRVGRTSGAADAEIEKNGAGHDRHVGDAGVVSNAALFEKIAHAAGGFETKGAAPREHDGMHIRRDMAGVQRVELAGTGGRTADVHAAHRIGAAENDSASGESYGVRCVTHQNAGNVGQSFIGMLVC